MYAEILFYFSIAFIVHRDTCCITLIYMNYFFFHLFCLIRVSLCSLVVVCCLLCCCCLFHGISSLLFLSVYFSCAVLRLVRARFPSISARSLFPIRTMKFIIIFIFFFVFTYFYFMLGTFGCWFICTSLKFHYVFLKFNVTRPLQCLGSYRQFALPLMIC